MKTYGGIDIEIHVFLTLALVGGEGSASCHGHFIPRGKSPSTYWTGGWVSPRTSPDMEKWKISSLPGLRLQSLDCPACSQSLYWLHCYCSFFRQIHTQCVWTGLPPSPFMSARLLFTIEKKLKYFCLFLNMDRHNELTKIFILKCIRCMHLPILPVYFKSIFHVYYIYH
jgi:hypothetical protein